MDPKEDVRTEAVQVEQKAAVDEKELSKKRHLNVVFIGHVDVQFLPISDLLGVNMNTRMGKTICPWWDGPCLFEALDGTEIPPRDPRGPFRMPVSDRFKDNGIPALFLRALAIAFLIILCPLLIPALPVQHYSTDRNSWMEFIGSIQVTDELHAKLVDEKICPNPSITNTSSTDYVELTFWCNPPADGGDPPVPGHSISRHNAIHVSESVWQALFLKYFYKRN